MKSFYVKRSWPIEAGPSYWGIYYKVGYFKNETTLNSILKLILSFEQLKKYCHKLMKIILINYPVIFLNLLARKK